MNNAGLRKDEPDQRNLTISEPESSIRNLRGLQTLHQQSLGMLLTAGRETEMLCPPASRETAKTWGITESQTGLESKGP